VQAAVAAAASNVVDSFITEDEVVEGVAHGLVEVPYHLAVVVTKLSKAQRMMWDKTTTKTSALASSDRSGPLEALSPALPLARPEETMIFALGSRAVVHPQPSATISLAAVATCVRQPLSEILQPAAASWRAKRHISSSTRRLASN